MFALMLRKWMVHKYRVCMSSIISLPSMALAVRFSTSSTQLTTTKSYSIIKTRTTHITSFTYKKATFVISASLPENAPAPVVKEQLLLEADVGLEGETNGVVITVVRFENPKWLNGTWDLMQFQKDGSTDWDAVIDAEVKRRKWLEENPESSSNDYPVSFDTSVIPWWAWIKRFHLPEAELLNGRAAMIGFFMAYFVDSLTGVGLVDQMGDFFCKSLLFIAVAGVLLFRKNEDVDNLKKLIEETTFYDKQWQATWQDEPKGKSKSD